MLKFKKIDQFFVDYCLYIEKIGENKGDSLLAGSSLNDRKYEKYLKQSSLLN